MNLTQNFELVWPKLKIFNATTQDDGKGELEKVLAMVILGLGSFIAGLLPAFISERNRQRFPLTTSLLLCFGAGILLATALVHILPEVRKQLNSNWAEISLCAGFFAIYLIDEFMHYFSHKHDSHIRNITQTANTTTSSPNGHHHHNYGSLNNSETAPLLNSNSLAVNCESLNHDLQPHHHDHTKSSHNRHEEHHQHVHCNDEILEDANASICHTEPCSRSMTGTLGLFVGLCLHSVIEGLAIGVQDSSTKVLFLLGAVACHKFVMGFCLGLIFRSNPHTALKSQIIGMSVFALGGIVGIGLGMIIVDVPSSWSTTALPIIQGLAGGTLLFVTVCEVIPSEKAKWHLNSERRLAGIAQFLIVAVGFTVMCAINFYFDDDS